MLKEYDFSEGKRGKFFKTDSTLNLPVYLDSEVMDYFSNRAKVKGLELNTMLNNLLKKDIVLIEGVK